MPAPLPALDAGSDSLLARARRGDDAAFRDLTNPHRRELHAHCYRMLGSVHDADDALQDTLLAAWRGLPGFEGRASVRTWLYSVATHRCLNLCRTVRRRPALAWAVPGAEPPPPSSLGEVHWLEPYPDALLDAVADSEPGPEAHYARAESISLAFVTALQHLPPRQVAVLILREVAEFQADEVAALMGMSVDAVNSALKRARQGLQRLQPTSGPARPVLADAGLIGRFVRAYEAADLDALVALLTDDVFVSMPPVPLEYRGPQAVANFMAAVTFRAGRRYVLRPTRANGQPAFGTYLFLPDGRLLATGLIVVELAEHGVRAMVRFEPELLARFGLPAS